MNKAFDHDDMVANILHYRRSATVEQVEAGTSWYPLAGDIVALIADRTGVDRVPHHQAHALAGGRVRGRGLDGRGRGAEEDVRGEVT